MIKAIVYVDDKITPEYKQKVKAWQKEYYDCCDLEAIDAANGYSDNMDSITTVLWAKQNMIVLTNSLDVFNTGDIKVLLNKKNYLKDYYILANNKIFNICDLTEKGIKCPHNLAKLYTNGGFELFEEKFYER